MTDLGRVCVGVLLAGGLAVGGPALGQDSRKKPRVKEVRPRLLLRKGAKFAWPR